MEDKSIRVLFWRPNKANNADLDFHDCLLAISGQPNPLDFTDCAGGLRLRTEHISQTDTGVEGDFIRQQTDNVPPNAHAGMPLEPNPNPIGHRAAFIYSTFHNVLVLQGGRPGVSPTLVNSFIRRRISNHKGFMMEPCLTSNALQRIRQGTPKKVSFRIAQPSSIEDIEPEFADIRNGLKLLQSYVDGGAVELTVGRAKGVREGFLNSERVISLIDWVMGRRHQVEMARVTIDEEKAAIDVLAERLDHVEVIKLDADDLDRAYQQRIDLVRRAFDSNVESLNSIYG
jgi:hypothetical protein